MSIRWFLIGVLSVVSCFSCARTGNMVVLLPDTDGKTGRIVVSSKGGSQSLGEAGQATSLQSLESAPSAPLATLKKRGTLESFLST